MPAQDLQVYLEEFYSAPAISNDISSPQKDMIVACHENSSNDKDPGRNEVIGFALLTRGTNEPCIADCENPVELQRIYVDPKCHGMGIGKLLARRVEEMAREQGFRTMWLGVWEENFKAQRVYERLGYERVGDHDFRMGACVQRDLILAKSLAP
jgi:ribosomal protein S18 acetylase RimI-like enzyme